MKLYIKNMVSKSCKIIVNSELEKFGLHVKIVELGEVEIVECLSEEQFNLLNASLKKSGFALIDDKRIILIEKIKNTIIKLLYDSEEPLKVNLSDYLGEKIAYDYTYLSNQFKKDQGITIEHFYLIHKIELVKELLVYDELNLTEIAYKLHYSSVAHLSNQFKKITGLSPSHFKKLKENRRRSLGTFEIM